MYYVGDNHLPDLNFSLKNATNCDKIRKIRQFFYQVKKTIDMVIFCNESTQLTVIGFTRKTVG